MEDERTKLICLIADPATDLVAIRRALNNKPDIDLDQGGYLSEKDACKFLGGISRSTLYSYRKRGLESLKLGEGKGARRIYSREALKAFAEKEGN